MKHLSVSTVIIQSVLYSSTKPHLTFLYCKCLLLVFFYLQYGIVNNFWKMLRELIPELNQFLRCFLPHYFLLGMLCNELERLDMRFCGFMHRAFYD